MWRAALALLCLGATAFTQSFAQSSAVEQADALLARMAQAARQLTFQGVFTYRYGNLSESSRIVHIADEQGELEKIELLEGPPREIIRNRDEVWCYNLDTKTIKYDRAESRRFFPSLIPDSPATFSHQYRATIMGSDRVAGRECQVMILAPRDGLRYGYRFCADRETGLLLRSAMVRGKDEILEQFAFSEIRIGEVISREQLRPTYADAKWPVERARVVDETRWIAKSLPAGFRKIMQTERRLASHSNTVMQWLLTDGFAAVSVFIEPQPRKAVLLPKPIQQGPVSFYSRQLQDHLITVLGEVPPLTVMQIADAITPRVE